MNVCPVGSCVLGGIEVQPTKDGKCLVCKTPFVVQEVRDA